MLQTRLTGLGLVDANLLCKGGLLSEVGMYAPYEAGRVRLGVAHERRHVDLMGQ
jgi:hypothetical protein